MSVVKLAIDEKRTAEVALNDVWLRLAPVIERANTLQLEVARNPTRAADRDVEPYLRWLKTFYEELAAIQTLNEASSRVNAEDLRAAHVTAMELLRAIEDVTQGQEEARVEEVPPPNDHADPSEHDESGAPAPDHGGNQETN